MVVGGGVEGLKGCEGSHRWWWWGEVKRHAQRDKESDTVFQHRHPYDHRPPPRTDGVLETIMTCTGEDVVGTAQLLQVTQALELRRVHDLELALVQFDVTVDGIIDDLGVVVVLRGVLLVGW